MGAFGSAGGVRSAGQPVRGIALDIGSSRTRAWTPGAGVYADVPSGPVRRGRVTDTDAQLRLLRRLTLDLPEGVTAYLCGPLPFLRAVRGDLLGLGVPAAGIHYEVFGPDLWLGAEG